MPQQIRVDQVSPGTGNADKVVKVSSDGTYLTFGTAVGGSGGGLDTPVQTTTTYSASAGQFVKCYTPTANVNVTIPDPALIPVGSVITVKKMDGTAYYVKVIPQNSATIDGDPWATIESQWTTASFIADGTQWLTKSTARDDPGGANDLPIKDRFWTPAPNVTSIDEFNNDSLDAAWARVDNTGAAGRVVWTEGADVLSAKTEGGDAAGEMHGMMRTLTSAGGPLAVGDAFHMGIQLFGPWATNYVMGGLIISNGVTYGAGVQAMTLDQITGAPQTHDLRSRTNWSTDGTTVGAQSNAQGHKMYVRIVMTATNTFRRDLSSDGVSWIIGTATATATMTPTHVGLAASSWGTATKGIVSYEFLRRASGVT